MKISALVSTRKRLGMLLNMWSSAINLAKYPENLELILYIDDDDEQTKDYYNRGAIYPGAKAIIGPRLDILGQTTNECYKISCGDICMVCTDDLIFHTQHWDEMVVSEFESISDRILLVYGEDGIQHGGIATVAFISRNWVDAVGYVLPTYFVKEYGDLWLTDVANMIHRRKYLPDMYIEHLHHHAGKMEIDDTATERERMHKSREPSIGYHNYYHSLVNKRMEDALKLGTFIKNFGH